MEDREIVDLLFARSERGLDELERKYGRRLHALAMNILADSRDADECLNDVRLAVWNAIPPERPERLTPWLSRVTRNTALSLRRGSRAQKRFGGYDAALDELAESLAAPGSVSDELEAKELAGLIERFLDSLSAENRVIFLRRYWYGDEIGEIARRTKLTAKLVTLRLTRLRKRLRRYLEESEVWI
ncbi:MAG TPA: sigma-70 family RNA polymerase sigma factor [Candidatus Scatomorpha merdipullorum]|uniref:Sigma-70 family RNA polymerase sigma factor n=1 Tax=Candidatus Scatomorpha merdipullorum TaxID=2840927 RepID=A0A9D1JUY8_9FIRM|nr:sigma-70 family RNA polymerase sigma factor [Candidatus Scatomorpha merdipullorum]